MSNKLDLSNRLRVLAGQELPISNGLKIRKYTLGEIIEYGYEDFLLKTSFLFTNSDDLVTLLGETEHGLEIRLNQHKYKEFDVLMLMSSYNDDLKNMWISSLEFVLDLQGFETNINDGIEDKELIFFKDDCVVSINKDTYPEIISMVKHAYGYDIISKEGDIENSDWNPSTQRAKEIIDAIERGRKKVKEINDQKARNSSDGKSVDLYRVVNGISSRSNSLNKINIFDLTLSQIYEEFYSLIRLDQYDGYVKSLMFGGKATKDSVTTWY